MGSPSNVRIATAAVVPGSTPTTVYIESPISHISGYTLVLHSTDYQ
jgi:hypothetical protein